jgi:hypothetical protein
VVAVIVVVKILTITLQVDEEKNSQLADDLYPENV